VNDEAEEIPALDRPALVLHEIGDPGGGGPWRAALEDAGWRGVVLAPDLPGHGAEPPPVGGNYELMDPAYAAVRALGAAGRGDDRPVVIGVGTSGWSAHVLALGGRASGLVLVDGLGGPWADPRTVIAGGRDWLRAIADDPAAVAPPPPGTLDPRAGHGVPPHGSRRLVERAAAATPVPTLLVESAGSPLARSDVDAVAALFPGVAGVVEVARPAPAAVAAALVTAWAHDG